MLDTVTSLIGGGAARHAPAAPLEKSRAEQVTRWGFVTVASLVAALLALLGIAALRWQLAGEVVPWDSKNQFYPAFRLLGDSLRHGTVPLWNPYIFAGYPAVADPQSLIFTPSMALCAALFPQASMQVFDTIVLGHLFVGGCGVLALARQWRWHPAPALLAAVVFMFGGSAAGRLQHTGMIISYAIFPLALWSLDAALRKRSVLLGLCAGVLTALMALGRDQVAFLLCLTLAAFALRQLLVERDDNRGRLRVLAVASVVTVVLVSVPALLTMQFLHYSNRPGIAFGKALEGSLNPINLLTLLAPNVFGSLDKSYDYWGPGAATLAGNDWTDRCIDYLFAGTLPITLIVVHGLFCGRLFVAGASAFAILLLGAFLYAVGRHSPVFALAFDWVPGVSLYRRPADATFIANIAIALLSGFLLDRYIRRGSPAFPRMRFGGAVFNALLLALGAVLIGKALAFVRATGHLSETATSLAAAIAAAGAILAILAVRFSPERRRFVALGLVILTCCQLLWLNEASSLNAEPQSTYSAYSGLYPDQRRGLSQLVDELHQRAQAGDHPRIEILGLDGSWQNAASLLKLEDTAGYNPLRIAAYERLVGVGESANDYSLRQYPDSFRGYNSRLASLLGLDYLILDRPVGDLPRSMPRPRATLLFGGDHFYVYRLQNAAVPRAFFTSTRLPTSGDDKGDIALKDDADPGAPSSAKIVRYDDSAVTIDVDAAHDGWLELNDLYYPGWRATVDNTAVPILRANALFRAVAVPSGHHTVEFSFHPFALGNLAQAAAQLIKP